MNNNSTTDVEAQGAETINGLPDLQTIEKWITKDLGVCLTFLNAIHNDKELRQQMAVFLQGRMQNSLTKPDPNQIKMKL